MAPHDRRPPLSEAERAKFVRICGMLGSSFENERATAARFATEFLVERRLSWEDVVCACAEAGIAASGLASILSDWPTRWRAAVDMCLHALTLLGERERKFIQSLAGYRNRPTGKQLSWLRMITVRVVAGGAA